MCSMFTIRFVQAVYLHMCSRLTKCPQVDTNKATVLERSNATRSEVTRLKELEATSLMDEVICLANSLCWIFTFVESEFTVTRNRYDCLVFVLVVMMMVGFRISCIGLPQGNVRDSVQNVGETELKHHQHVTPVDRNSWLGDRKCFCW